MIRYNELEIQDLIDVVNAGRTLAQRCYQQYQKQQKTENDNVIVTNLVKAVSYFDKASDYVATVVNYLNLQAEQQDL